SNGRTTSASSLADHATRNARAGIAGGLSLVVVRTLMDDDRLADNICGSATDGHRIELSGQRGRASAVGVQHGHVASVVLAACGIAMRLAERIEVAARAHPVVGAAISLFVNMEPMLSRGESGHVGGHDDLVAFLSESHRAARSVALGRLQARNR